MGIDELYYHRRRGLPAWEIWSHPIDTLTTFACITFLLLTPPSAKAAWVYAGLAAASALLATKDEFVHLARCERGIGGSRRAAEQAAAAAMLDVIKQLK